MSNNSVPTGYTPKDEIKQRVSIFDLVSETVTLKKSGKNYKGFCPFHKNTNSEALAIFPETQTWSCFGSCGENGDIFSWIMKRDSLDFPAALQKLAQQANLSPIGHSTPVATKKTAELAYDYNRSPDVIYPYRDETGREVAQICRQDFANDKAIRARYHNGKNWVWERPDNMPLYHLPELMQADHDLWVHLAEGEKNTDSLIRNGFISTTNAFGAGSWDNRNNIHFTGRKIAIYQDNDTAGQNRVNSLALALYDVAQEVKIVTPESIRISNIPKGDITNAFELGITPTELETIIEGLPPYHPPDHILHRAKLWDVDDLMSTVFPARKWRIADLLPDGLILLAGKQKVGKSWFVLQLLLALSQGRPFLGYQVEATKCLYLGLEDGTNRLQDRLLRLNYQPGKRGSLLIKFEWPNLVGENGLDELEQSIIDHQLGAIVIDTFTRACLGVDQLKIDHVAPVLSRIQTVAMEHQVSIIITDHLKKPNGAARDSLYDVYGSIAKTMLADVIWGLSRDKDDLGQFTVEGRDIPQEFDFAVKFDRPNVTWQLLGEYSKVVMGEPEKKVLQALLDLGGRSYTDEIAEHLGEKSKGYVSTALSKLLGKGRVKKPPKEGKIQPYEVIEIE